VDDVDEILKNPEDFGIDIFLDKWPEEKDPNYWPEGSALLIKFEVLVINPKD